MEESANLKPMQSNCWSGGILLETVRRLNERGLALLTKVAQASEAMDGFASWKEILPLWAHPSEQTLGRAARCPMVLLDFNFQRVAWWRRVVNAHAPGGSRQTTGSGFHTDEAIPPRARSIAGSLECLSFRISYREPGVWYGAGGHRADCTALALRCGSSGRERGPRR